MVHRTEVETEHRMEIRVLGEDGNEVVRVQMGFGVSTPEQVPVGEEAAVVIPWNFPGKPQLPGPGRYSMEILIDNIHQTSVAFTAEEGMGGEPNESQQ